MAVLLETGYNDTQSGGREDLSDLISNVDARSTVFTSLAKKERSPVMLLWDGRWINMTSRMQQRM